MDESPRFHPPIEHESAEALARVLAGKLSLDRRIDLIGGHKLFFIRGYPELGIPQLYLSDATAGVHIRRQLDDQLEKSVAFPAPVALAASWNPDLAGNVARAIGEECRAGGIAVLLGPGMNIYRVSQCGRNFEYFGEDPFLVSMIVENFVTGVQSTGTIATLKHFVCNNTDFCRRRSNSVVDERALHEIYLPAFKAGIDAGAMAVMTSYNQLNGEWTGQSEYVIDKLLRKELGFKWLVMTDWWSTYDPEKVIRSGQDLEMPGASMDGDKSLEKLGDVYVRTNATRLLKEGKLDPADIDRMALSILTTEVAMGLTARPVKDESFLDKFWEHEEVALQEAREGIVLLRNCGNILPIRDAGGRKIVLTGDYVTRLARGGGSALVEGYNAISMLDALREEFGRSLVHAESPSDHDITDADVVLVSIGTDDSEGQDRPFDLPEETDLRILHYASLNPNIVVIVNSGGGVRMTKWNELVSGIVYAWYPGQLGNKALAEIMSGKVNPSGKLPITIEKEFADSPGHSYLPSGRSLDADAENDLDQSIPVYDIHYDEGVFVGYRWYESRNIEPLYHFGFGLSYTRFQYSGLRLSDESIKGGDTLIVEFEIENTGEMTGAEIAQMYVREINPAVDRPMKELKGFRKVTLKPGERKKISIPLGGADFSFWDTETHTWRITPGMFEIVVGAASNDIRLSGMVTVDL